MLTVPAIGIMHAGDIGQRLAALLNAGLAPEFKLMVIPSADNFICNKMIVGGLKSGIDSQSSELIADMLKGSSPLHRAITSENDAVGAATLERGMRSLKGISSGAHELAFVGARIMKSP